MQSAFVVAAARTRMGVGRRVGVRQDSSDSGVKTAATEAAVAAWTWIGSGSRAVAGHHRVGSISYDSGSNGGGASLVPPPPDGLPIMFQVSVGQADRGV